MLVLASTLWKCIKTRTDVKAISNRPTRIPFQVQTGGKFVFGSDGDMGRGSVPTTVYGNLSCVLFLQASGVHCTSEYSTDSNEKAIENYVTLTQKQAAETFSVAIWMP